MGSIANPNSKQSLRGIRPGLRPVILLCAAWLAWHAPIRAAVTPEDVQAAIASARRYVNMRLDSETNYGVGDLCLRAMALMHSGSNPNSPEIRRLLAKIVKMSNESRERYIGTYKAGLIIVALSMARDPQYAPVIRKMVYRLSRTRNKDGGWGDMSRTQFALLGLYEAFEADVSVNLNTIRAARKYLWRAQNIDGGFGYVPGNGSYGSMTCAGLAGLYLCDTILRKSAPCCQDMESQARIELALTWLANHFSVGNNPNHGRSYYFYYLYALERAGEYSGRMRFGEFDWYRSGAALLVRIQKKNGSWGSDLNTYFSLLFLGKGAAPVGIAKLDYGPGWDLTPMDVKNLTRYASTALKTPISFITVKPDDPAGAMQRAPILYMQGNETYTPNERLTASLRRFISTGGTLLAIPCCGGQAFDESFRKSAKTIFGSDAFVPLPDDHPVYRSPFLIPKEARDLEGLVIECRWAVFISNSPLNYGWAGCDAPSRGQPESPRWKTPPDPITSLKLGVNLIAYAVGYHRLMDKFETINEPGKSEHARCEDGLVIGRLETDTGAPAGGLLRLLDALKRAGLEGNTRVVSVKLRGDDPYQSPLMYLTGYRSVTLSGNEIKKLNEYLDRGGMLWIDPCCQPGPMMDSARKLMQTLAGNDPVETLTPDNDLFSTATVIERVDYTPAAKRRYPKLDDRPAVQAIVRNGRIVVVMSPVSVGCGLEGGGNDAIAYTYDSALKMAMNILMYSVTH